MQTNLSLVVNILLLVGVVIAISRVMKSKRQMDYPDLKQPSIGKVDSDDADDIISVRKIDIQNDSDFPLEDMEPKTDIKIDKAPTLDEVQDAEQSISNGRIMIILMAKDNRHFAGYELLQTLLTSGLRFGEGQLFHRHQYSSGQGPVLCSLAAATKTGKFDMQNMGSFEARGLCLFMEIAHNPGIDGERLTIMIDTAKQLSEGLDCVILDENKQPLTETKIMDYKKALKVIE